MMTQLYNRVEPSEGSALAHLTYETNYLTNICNNMISKKLEVEVDKHQSLDPKSNSRREHSIKLARLENKINEVT